MTTTYNPEHDQAPNFRDELAMREMIPPFVVSVEHICKTLDLKPSEVDPVKHIPIVIARWRYAMADAMLNERKRAPSIPDRLAPKRRFEI